MTNFEFLERHHGLTRYAWQELRRLERKLHTWDEMRCNGEIQYDNDGSVYCYARSRYGDFTENPQLVRDEAAALLSRAQHQAERFGLKAYHQGDPRGCSLYVYTQQALEDILKRNEQRAQYDVSTYYTSVGTAVS